MPRTVSAKKALRKDRRRKAVNLVARKKFKEEVKTARQNPTAKSLAEAFRSLDRAAKKKVIHKGKANRLKSRLSKLIKSTSPVATKKTTAKKVPKVKKKK